MSMPEKESIQCPRCGSEVELTLWQSINTDMDFAIPDIISGKLFDVTCPDCGQQIRVDYTMLFNDMIHQVMIQYLPKDEIEEISLSGFMMRRIVARARVVTSQASLSEKVAIFNAGLDDRIVELLKVFIVKDASDRFGWRGVDDIHCYPGDDELTFDLRIGDEFKHTVIPLKVYHGLETKYGNKIAESEEEMVIDYDWAMRFLDSLN